MRTVSINLNQKVYVKLNALGYQIWYDYWHANDHLFEGKTNPFSDITIEYLKSKEVNGEISFQWHEFMSIFGGDYISLTRQTPFNITVRSEFEK